MSVNKLIVSILFVFIKTKRLAPSSSKLFENISLFNTTNKNLLVFLGDSFTYGVGLNYEQTFVSKIEKDDIDSIYKAAFECARTYSYGGGIGVDISSLRPKNSVVHNAADSSTGAVSFMELYSLTTGLIGQSGRRGALMLTIDVKHPDIKYFLKVKKIAVGA